MKKLSTSLIILILLSFTVFAQVVEEPKSEKNDEAAKKDKEVRAKAVEMLRETARDLASLRTTENRISFSSDLANLMWLHDGKEAKAMFRRVTDDYVQLLTQYNSRVVALGGMDKDSPPFAGPFNPDPDERTKAVKQMNKAMMVRQKIAMSMGEFDAESAYEFTVRTSDLVTDENLSERFKSQNERIERLILASMRSEDVDVLVAFGKKSLERGYKSELLTLAAKIKNKDKEEGEDFAELMQSKVISDAEPNEKAIQNLYSVLEANNKGTEEAPLFNEDQRREVARSLGNNLLRTPKDFESYQTGEYVSAIEEFDKGLADRVKRKFESEEDEAEKAAARAIRDAAEKAADAATDADAGDDIKIIGPPKEAEKSPFEELMEISKEAKDKELSKEQKAEFIGKAREIISKIDRPTMKITALSGLALQVNKLGDKELAREIMNEAAPFVNQQPKHFMDYLTLWTFVTGASAVDPETAFISLEDGIFRLSDTVDAFVKVAEFIDVGGDFVIDRELQLGTFGGGIVQGFVAQAQSATPVMRNLAIADFDRTRELANKFEQPEIRILAKLIILKSVLDEPTATDGSALFMRRGIF